MPLLVLTVLLAASAPAPSAAVQTPAPATVACDVQLKVADPDPKGLNVRAGPSATAPIVGVLKPDGDWTWVHATGQGGDWIAIDRAETIDDDAPNGSRAVYAKTGWVHVGKLGISELQTGNGTVLRDRPAADARVVKRIGAQDTAPVRVLGCHGKFIEVRTGRLRGWTDRWCNNERTTCS